MSMKKLIQSVLTLCLLFAPVVLWAQSGATLTGKVTDAQTGDPLPGTNVYISGSQLGGSANPNGDYTINNIPTGQQTVIATFIGYSKFQQIITVEPGTNTFNIQLKPASIGLDDIVVTALGFKREERSLGYSVQQVGGDQVAGTRESNVVNALAGQVAGVQINSSSGQPGKSSRIIIRGNSSFLGNNQPLFVVDGVPISNSQDANIDSDPLFTGGTSNRGIDLDPNTIASVSVLKGASATALYGSRAANGAIVITTKGAEAGQGQTRVTVNSRVSWDDAIIKGYQDQYLQGRNGAYANGTYTEDPNRTGAQTTNSWGPHKDSVSAQVLSDLGVDHIQTYNPRKDFYDTGITYDNNFSISGGRATTNYYLSASNLNQGGIVPGTELDRSSIMAKFSTDLNDKLHVNTSANYIKTKNIWMSEGNGTSNYLYGLNFTPINFNIKDYQQEDGSQNMYYPAFNNPIWLTKHNDYSSDVDRLIGNTHLQYDILPWLNIAERLGIDTYGDKRKKRVDVGTRGVPNGSMYDRKISRSEINSDLTVNADVDLNKNFGLTAMLGNNINARSYDYEIVRGEGLGIPGFFHISNAQTVTGDQYQQQRRLVSLYSQATLDYQDIVYLTLTGRNDWSSTLPTSNNSYFYPSASLGVVFTDAVDWFEHSPLSYGKIRLSASQIGNDAPVYSLSTNYVQANPGDGVRGNINYPYAGVNGTVLSNQLGNPDLKPELSTEYEAGLNLRFFEGRAGLDVSYYDRHTKDQIFSVPMSASSGYVSRLINAGEMKNSGVELALNGSPVQTRDFEWSMHLNFSKNKTDVVSLAQGVESIYLGGFTDPQIRIMPRENGYGIIWGSRFKRNKDLPADQQFKDADPNAVLIGDDGYPVVASDLGPIGNVQPDWMANFRTTLNYKGVSLSALLDMSQGGDIMNMDLYYSSYYGTAKVTENRGSSYTYQGINANTGAANTKSIVRDQSYYQYFYSYVDENFVEDASYLKLRELTLSYTLPTKLLSNTPFRSAQISATGRNLWIDTNFSYGDPTGTLYGSGNAQGFYHSITPSTRSYSVSVKLSI